VVPDLDAHRALVTELPELAARLARAFWPGPMTLVLEAKPGLDPRVVLDGRVAVRVPGPCLAADILREVARPLTATSANLPGSPPALDEQQVLEAFPEAVRSGHLCVVPGGAPGGAPSSMVQILRGAGGQDDWQILRVGSIADADLRRVLEPSEARG
jgi:tRNA A37 threonylcarbamoyladenosine synthetase subunit TsaC/SUA5/YrdC